jgi:hypothetical protein
MTAERNQALAKLEAVRNLVDRSEDLAAEIQLLSQGTEEPDSVYKQKIKEYQKRTVKVCWIILTILWFKTTFQSFLLPKQLEETEEALAELKSQLASLQKTVDHLTNVEKELVDCRIALVTTQKSREEVQHTADARAEEIRRLCSQLEAVTVKTEQAKFWSMQNRGQSITLFNELVVDVFLKISLFVSKFTFFKDCHQIFFMRRTFPKYQPKFMLLHTK